MANYRLIAAQDEARARRRTGRSYFPAADLAPLTRQTYMRSGGAAYSGSSEDDIGGTMHPAQPYAATGAGRFANAQRASNAEWDRIRSDINFNYRANPNASLNPFSVHPYGSQNINDYPPEMRAGLRKYVSDISRPPLRRDQMTTLQLSGGGTTTVPTTLVSRIMQAVPRAQPYNPLQASDLSAAYRRGYGAPTPTVQPSVSGPVLAQRGVANPVENLSPQQRIQYGSGTGFDFLRANPALSAIGTLGYNAIASLFRSRGGQVANAAPVAQPQSNPAYFAYNPSPAPPRRYFDSY